MHIEFVNSLNVTISYLYILPSVLIQMLFLLLIAILAFIISVDSMMRDTICRGLVGSLNLQADLGLEEFKNIQYRLNISHARHLTTLALRFKEENDTNFSLQFGLGTVLLHHSFNLLHGYRDNKDFTVELGHIIREIIQLLPHSESIHLPVAAAATVVNVYSNDPPLIFKSFSLRQLSITKLLLEFSHQNELASAEVSLDGSSNAHAINVDLAHLLLDNTKRDWLSRLFSDIYSVPSEELVPLAKLLLHARSLVKQTGPKTSDDVTAMARATQLLRRATLSRAGKPVISPTELCSHSQTFNSIILPFVASAGDAEDSIIGVELLDIMASLGEVVDVTVHAPIVNYIIELLRRTETNLLGKEAADRLVDLLTSSANRSPLHALFLAGPGAAAMMAGLTRLVSAMGAFSVEHDEQGWMERVKNRLVHGIFGSVSADIRGHHPFSYYFHRWSKVADWHDYSRTVRALAAAIGVDFDKEIKILADREEPSSHKPSDSTHSGDDFLSFDDEDNGDGGWDPARLTVGGKEDGDRCDILEVWSENNSLPDSREFFARFVNTATPVIFRFNETAASQHDAIRKKLKGRAKLRFRQPRVESVRSSLQRDVFLQKFGQIVVPVSSIPYAGSVQYMVYIVAFDTIRWIACVRVSVHSSSDFRLVFMYLGSFGKKSSSASLSELVAGASSVSETQRYLSGLSNSSTPAGGDAALPLYTFSTPSPQWEKLLRETVTIPESMLCKDTHDGDDCSVMGAFDPTTSAWYHELQFYLGAAGTGSPIHFHGHAINTLAYGEKVSQYHHHHHHTSIH